MKVKTKTLIHTFAYSVVCSLCNKTYETIEKCDCPNCGWQMNFYKNNEVTPCMIEKNITVLDFPPIGRVNVYAIAQVSE